MMYMHLKNLVKIKYVTCINMIRYRMILLKILVFTGTTKTIKPKTKLYVSNSRLRKTYEYQTGQTGLQTSTGQAGLKTLQGNIGLLNLIDASIIGLGKICSTGIYLRRRSGVFIVNFEQISHIVVVFLLLTLNM